MANTRVILFDIETLPILSEALKVWPQLSNYPGQTLKAQICSVINVGWKVLDEKKTECVNAWDLKGWKKSVNDDKELCKIVYDVLKDADVVITHNGRRFDWRFIQTRLLIHGLPILPKIIHKDTCQEAKKSLFAFNNRLNTLADCFSIRKKVEHEGWDLWVKVHGRDPKAMALMTKYCKGDVLVLEDLFKVMRPLITGMPNQNQFTEDACCPKCGSEKLHARGFAATKDKILRRMQCMDCKGWATIHPKGVKEL